MESPFLTEREAAAFLRLAPGTLQNRRVSGTGPPFLKLGGRVVYRREDLANWAEERRKRSTRDQVPDRDAAG